jgi:hypothetical protein
MARSWPSTGSPASCAGCGDRRRFERCDIRTVLRVANIFSKPVGNDLHHGNLGMDLLSQASDLTIDFESMSLTLR